MMGRQPDYIERPAPRPNRDFYRMTDQEVAAACAEYLRAQGAIIEGAMRPQYPSQYPAAGEKFALVVTRSI